MGCTADDAANYTVDRLAVSAANCARTRSGKTASSRRPDFPRITRAGSSSAVLRSRPGLTSIIHMA
jgi:hypothetical protein